MKTVISLLTMRSSLSHGKTEITNTPMSPVRTAGIKKSGTDTVKTTMTSDS